MNTVPLSLPTLEQVRALVQEINNSAWYGYIVLVNSDKKFELRPLSLQEIQNTQNGEVPRYQTYAITSQARWLAHRLIDATVVPLESARRDEQIAALGIPRRLYGQYYQQPKHTVPIPPESQTILASVFGQGDLELTKVIQGILSTQPLKKKAMVEHIFLSGNKPSAMGNSRPESWAEKERARQESLSQRGEQIQNSYEAIHSIINSLGKELRWNTNRGGYSTTMSNCGFTPGPIPPKKSGKEAILYLTALRRAIPIWGENLLLVRSNKRITKRITPEDFLPLPVGEKGTTLGQLMEDIEMLRQDMAQFHRVRLDRIPVPATVRLTLQNNRQERSYDGR